MPRRPPPPTAWLALAIGALAAAWGGPFILYAEEAAALVKAAWRTGLAALVLLPFAAPALAPSWRRLPARERGLLLGAGAALALHFAAWIASFAYTSVASSLVLVSTTPLFTAWLSPRLTGDRPSRRELVGIGVALAGVIVIGAGDFRVGGQAWIGDLLAVAGAAAGAVYLMLSRRLQRLMPASVFLTSCYGGAALWLLLACLALRLPLAGFETRTTLALVGLAAVPQLLGHSGYNLAVRRIPAPTVAVAALSEPILGSLLAFLLFAERPAPSTLLGGAVILSGIVVTISGAGAARRGPSAQP